MSIAIPERIECCVTYGDRPIAGLLVRAELKIPQQKPYVIVIGPTMPDGRATVLREEIERQAQRQFESAIMDYNLLAGSFNGVIEVSIMKREDIAQALRGQETCKGAAYFPVDYSENLAKSEKILEALPAQKNLHLSVTVSSPFTRVIIK